jgi:hypothetical protein
MVTNTGNKALTAGIIGRRICEQERFHSERLSSPSQGIGLSRQLTRRPNGEVRSLWQP